MAYSDTLKRELNSLSSKKQKYETRRSELKSLLSSVKDVRDDYISPINRPLSRTGTYICRGLKGISTEEDFSEAIVSMKQSQEDQQIFYLCAQELFAGKKTAMKSGVVLIYSPCGGAGKTTLALGLSYALAAYHKRVLYLDAEGLQTFQSVLSGIEPIRSENIAGFYKEPAQRFRQINQCISAYAGFYCLRPFAETITSYGLSTCFFAELVDYLKEMNTYDFIIVDTDSSFGREKERLIWSLKMRMSLPESSPSDSEAA